MKITFLGTRGNIDIKSRKHFRHTITIISYKNTRVAIDCGLDWLTLHKKIMPVKGIVITHAHDDHVDGLKKGAPCPVYATKESWQVMRNFKISEKLKHMVKPYKPFKIGLITFTAFPVVHSFTAPAVGYRIQAGRVSIFCVHDLVSIKKQKAALKNIKLYIGDGASIKRPIIRKKAAIPFGHSPIVTQLKWLEKEGVPRAIFTHCGSQIVRENARKVDKIIKELGEEYQVNASVAYDGMSIILR